MTKITIESRLDFASYRNTMFYLFYKKPLIIAITILGIIVLSGSMAYAILVFQKIGRFPYIPLILGMILVFLMPYSVYSQSKKHYKDKPRIKEKLIYTFDDEKISVAGETFHGKIYWNKILRIQELKSCILIYQSTSAADIIPSKAFPEDNLKLFKDLVNQKGNIKKDFLKS